MNEQTAPHVITSHTVGFSDTADVHVTPTGGEDRFCVLVRDGGVWCYAYLPEGLLDRLVDRAGVALAEMRAERVA